MGVVRTIYLVSVMMIVVVTVVGVLGCGGFGGCCFGAYVDDAALAFQICQVALLAQGAPFERARFPQVQQAGDQNEDKDEHFNEAKPAGFAHRNGPREQKGGFKVEDDEKDGRQIKRYGDFEIGRTGADHARLVYVMGCMILALLTEQGGGKEKSHDEDDDDNAI